MKRNLKQIKLSDVYWNLNNYIRSCSSDNTEFKVGFSALGCYFKTIKSKKEVGFVLNTVMKNTEIAIYYEGTNYFINRESLKLHSSSVYDFLYIIDNEERFNEMRTVIKKALYTLLLIPSCR